MKKCCGKIPKLNEFHKTSADGRSIDFYWYECSNCGRRNSYSYDTPGEAEDAWNENLVSKPQPKN